MTGQLISLRVPRRDRRCCRQGRRQWHPTRRRHRQARGRRIHGRQIPVPHLWRQFCRLRRWTRGAQGDARRAAAGQRGCSGRRAHSKAAGSQERFPADRRYKGTRLDAAIELVKNQATKEPAPEATLQVFEETRRHGLVASRSGPYRNVIRMCPPLCLSMADLDNVVDSFVRSFRIVST
ncbi:aminotransferase class III-fold pyridoxal phosphate-dependent enzyme [Mesorhizobium sp. B2-1-3A]|nr:aminotransferase class III-fold pyridoxal phosphate-dependent enzyme [Mesorhizobium sp. B2-1-3A]